MGTLADSLFNILMGWVRALVNGIWALFDTEHTTILEFIGKNWLTITILIVAIGLVMDWLVWLIRWRPYHRAAKRARRFLHLDEEEEPVEGRAHAAVRREPTPMMKEKTGPVTERQKAPEIRTEDIPDAHAYPGMRYGTRPTGNLDETQRYAAVHSEGPGAAEVERRRAEIDAWRIQMEEERQAEARKAAYEAEQKRKAQAAYEAEQKRKAQAAYEAEQKRKAQAAYEAEQKRKAQAAYEAEQKRKAQAAYKTEQKREAQPVQAGQRRRAQTVQQSEQTAAYSAQQAEYARQMAEYEKKKAQYEQEMAEYQRKKAAYDAEMRRRQRPVYSEYVTGEAVDKLPDPPKWPKIQTEEKAAKPKSKLKERVAQMIEPENEEISPITSLPPRVDPKDAFHTAKMPAVKLPHRKR